MLCLLIFLVGWLEEGAGGFSWFGGGFGLEVKCGLEVRFGEVWFDSVFCLFCSVCSVRFVLFCSVWMAGWVADFR